MSHFIINQLSQAKFWIFSGTPSIKRKNTKKLPKGKGLLLFYSQINSNLWDQEVHGKYLGTYLFNELMNEWINIYEISEYKNKIVYNCPNNLYGLSTFL